MKTGRKLIGIVAATSLLAACDNQAGDQSQGSGELFSQAEDSNSCSNITRAKNQVLDAQAYAYFARHSSTESSVYETINRNGGTDFTIYPNRSGSCDFVFSVIGVVDGDSYNLTITCPILETEPTDNPGERSVSKIDIEECRQI